MTLARGRVVKGAGPVPVRGAAAHAAPVGVRVSRDEQAARARALALVAAAEREATAIVERAREEAEQLRRREAEIGRASGLSEFAAAALRLRELAAQADERALDRVVTYARVLAESLIERSLAESPDVVVELARKAMEGTGGARRIQFASHPDDVPALRAALRDFDPEGRVHAVVGTDGLARGDLRLDTDVGVLDARLGSSLERLAARLLEALRS